MTAGFIQQYKTGGHRPPLQQHRESTIMKTRHLIAIGITVMGAPAGFAAGRSDVADAAMRGDSAAVRTLITQGADVNARQGDGSTALHWAVYKGNLAMVDTLIAARADVKAATREGAT